MLLTGGPAGAPDTKVTTGTVRAVRDDGLTRTARIRENASYKLAVPPGNYRVEAKTPQMERWHHLWMRPWRPSPGALRQRDDCHRLVSAKMSHF